MINCHFLWNVVWGQQSCVGWIPRFKHCQPSPFSGDQGKDRKPPDFPFRSQNELSSPHSVDFPAHICKTKIAKGIRNPVANLTACCLSSPRRAGRGQRAHPVSSAATPSCVLSKGSFTEPAAPWWSSLSYLAVSVQPFASPLTHRRWNYRHVSPTWVFIRVWGNPNSGPHTREAETLSPSL